MSVISIILQMASGHTNESNATSPATLSVEYNSFAALLSWPAATSADTYQVQIATLADYSDAADIYNGALLLANTAVMLNKAYYFRIRGVLGASNGDWVTTTLSALSDGTTGVNAYFFGDSITTGVGASPTSNKFSTVLCAEKSWTENNFGISGYTVTANSCRTQYPLSNIPTKTNDMNYAFVALGVNDQFVNPEISNSEYQTALESLIDNAISKGWPVNRIIVLSPFYTTYTDGSGYCGSDNTDATRKLLFVAAALAAATVKDVNYIDMYNSMEDNGGAALLDDTLHPNNSGYSYIATLIGSLINNF